MSTASRYPKKIKTFKLQDLVGHHLIVRSFRDGETELIVAQDAINGELFVLEEIKHPTVEDPR